MTDPTPPKETAAETQRSTIGDLAEIFAQLADVPRDLQDDMLHELSPDPAFRKQVRAMLDADAIADPLLDHSLFPQPTPVNVGENIAGYNLVRELGHGGMGVVFQAEQLHPVRRTVALKIIKPGVDTRAVIERFNAERQALSLMNHPNIAKVLEVGSTERGRPFFVMELVDGQPITTYCDEKRLSSRERLELFLPVCHAIQHAHQKGIIHRDIKPSNILIGEYDGRPVAKVIDFGVAKAINQPLNEQTAFTRAGQIVGTFEYMSPEQSRVNQTNVDTRSDVYSLGVVLYELLTGHPPFDRERFRSTDWEEMLRIVREEDPTRPSDRLSRDSETRDTGKLANRVGHELDWIVMKAMEKDRNRRYVSPNDLANDIECYLRGDAVAAWPPSTSYRFRKFARRNKVAIATTALVCASLVLGMIGTTWQAIRASRAETKAEANAEKANEVSGYLKELLFGLVDSKPQLAETDPSVWMVSFFKKAADDADQRFANLPEISRELDSMFANTLSSLGDFEDATTLFERTLKSLEDEKGSSDPGTIAVRGLLAKSYIGEGRWDDARMQCEQALEDGSELGDEHPLTLQIWSDLATIFSKQGQHRQAVEIHQTCLDVKRNSLGEAHYNTLSTKSHLASVLESLKEFDEAETLRKQVVKAEETKSDLHKDYRLAVARASLGKCYLKRCGHPELVQADLQSKVVESGDLFHQSLQVFSRDRGPYDLETLDVQFHLAQTLIELGDYESAVPRLQEVVKRLPKNEHTMKASAMNMLGWTYLRRSRHADAERVLKEACEYLADSQSEAMRIQVMGNLSIAYNLLGKLGASVSLDQRTSKLAEQFYGSDHIATLSAKTRLGLGQLEIGETEKGRAVLEQAFNSSTGLSEARPIASALAASYLATGELDKAELWTARQPVD